VIEPDKKSIQVYTSGMKVKQIENKKLIQEYLIDISKHRLQIKKTGNKNYKSWDFGS